jgi:hypothetical protein
MPAGVTIAGTWRCPPVILSVSVCGLWIGRSVPEFGNLLRATWPRNLSRHF